MGAAAEKITEKPSIFGAAKVKATKSAAADDKEIVYIAGLEPKLLELQFLKAQISDLEAQLSSVTDEIKTIGKEEFVKLYQNKKTNPNTFYIKDGEGCVMVLPTDKYLSVKDEAAADSIRNAIGDDAVTVTERFYFNNDVLERNQAAIEAAIGDATTISDADKVNLLLKEVKYSIAKGFIDKFAQYGNDKIETVMDTVQPIIQLKNCGGKMEDGGSLTSSDHIANLYGGGGAFSPTNQTVWNNGIQTGTHWKGDAQGSIDHVVLYDGRQYSIEVIHDNGGDIVVNSDYSAEELNQNGGVVKGVKVKDKFFFNWFNK